MTPKYKIGDKVKLKRFHGLQGTVSSEGLYAKFAGGYGYQVLLDNYDYDAPGAMSKDVYNREDDLAEVIE